MKDLSHLKTAKGVASAVYRLACQIQEQTGGSKKHVYLWSPKESEERGYGKCWTVCWEEGPFEWACALSANEDLYSLEFGGYGQGKGQLDLCGHPTVFCEPYNSFVLCFYND